MAKMLVVDDSVIMRRSISTILKEAGHIIAAEAENGFQACVEFDKHRPDLVTMDIDMPFVSGMEALKSIVAKHPKANIIMISSDCSSRIICEAMNAGAKAFIIKPFSIQGLVDTINKVLDSESILEYASIERIYKTIEGF